MSFSGFATFMYVLTGGPSVGKTSIINELEKQGEPVIHEAASDWIAEKLGLGIFEFWREENIGVDILKMQLEREEPFLSKKGRVFIDRGIFDSRVYAIQNSLIETQALTALEKIDLNTRYAAIFFIQPHTSSDFKPEQTKIRRDTKKEAEELHASLYALYSRHNRFIVVPGDLSPQKRMNFILKYVEIIENEYLSQKKYRQI